MESRTSNYLIFTWFWKCLVSGECPHFLPSPKLLCFHPCLRLSSRFHPGLLDHSPVTTYTINYTVETSSPLEPFQAAESSPLNKKSKLSPELPNYSLNTVCFVLFFVYVCACLSACMYIRCLQEPEEARIGTRSAGTGITDGFRASYGC